MAAFLIRASILRRLGFLMVGSFVLLAILGPAFAPYGPGEWAGAPFLKPSPSHWLGTDDIGADLLSVWLHGARYSLVIATLSAACAVLLGAIFGAGAGYLGGWWNFAARRMMDFQLALPTLPLVLIVAYYAGPGWIPLIGVLIAGLWAPCAREIMPAAEALRHADFIIAERAMGASHGYILLRHIMPSLSPLLWAQFAKWVHTAVLLESALGFLGLSDPRVASWGRTLFYANARAAFLGDAWLWWVVPPGLAIALLVLGFSLIGVGRFRGVALGSAPLPHKPLPSAIPDPENLLEVGELEVSYAEGSGCRIVLKGLSLAVKPGEALGITGFSGAGKSTLVQALLGLLPPAAEVKGGAVWLDGIEILRLSERKRRSLRGAGLALVPQAAMDSLNPLRSVGSQLLEVARMEGILRRDARRAAEKALEQVGISLDWWSSNPHELSGGMRQRLTIAMALIRKPRVLLADEPGSGLDRDREVEILTFLRALCRECGMALILISHDKELLANHCDRWTVLKAGRLMDPEPTLYEPIEAYSSPISHAISGDPSLQEMTGGGTAEGPYVLEMREVEFRYGNIWTGLRDFNLVVGAGECVGLVGPSGAGKSTVARLAMGLLAPTRGTVRILGRDWRSLSGDALRLHRRNSHLIFQDPFASLPRRFRVGEIVDEPLLLRHASRASRRKDILSAVTDAGLLPALDYLNRPVDDLSGGERQRVALARALAARPRLIVADEPTSMLDSSHKQAWMRTLDGLRRNRNMSVLLITHDLPLARAYCDRIVVVGEVEGTRCLPYC